MRDVIQVERADGIGDASGDLAELGRVADELLPPLVARLGVSDLGEIEVRRGTWRVRIRRTAPDAHATAASATTTTGSAAAGAPSSGAPGAAAHAAPAHTASVQAAPAHAASASGPADHPVAISSAVGYFALRSGLAVGHRVGRGDVLGWVDVLGVRQEIVSPADGVIGRFVTEPGDPVEYGQELVALMAVTGVGAVAHGTPGDSLDTPTVADPA